MVDIEEMSIQELQINVHRRNAVISTLLSCKDKLMNCKKYELDNIVVDGNHAGADSGIRVNYKDIIQDINNLVHFMQHGDWSLSVDSTKEKEKLFKEE